MENKSRRSLLKFGVVGGIMLATGGAIYRSMHPAHFSRYQPDAEAETILRALIPAILDGALPSEPSARTQGIDRAVKNIKIAIAGLPYHSQKEVADLFALLSMSLSRRLLTGISDWASASSADVAVFLQEWRTHRTETLQTAYHALHDLTLGPWYGDPENWPRIGYPGPLKELSS